MALGNAQPQRLFLHYPQGHRLYVCIVDQQRRAFDLTDNTFKPGNKLASMRDACLIAEEQLDERADHGCSYSVEIDLARLLGGADPATLPLEGALATFHWLEQVGDDPDVTVDKRLTNSCSLRNFSGRFEPANKWDADNLDEVRAFEQRARSEKEYREFVLREIDSHDVRRGRLVTAVRDGDVAGVLRVLAEDVCVWAGNLKQHCIHQITHLAKDPSFVRTRMVPKDSPFQVFETWAVREWIGCHEAYDLIEFHKSAEFARTFSGRLNRLHEARVEFSQQVIEYTIQHRGEDVNGIFVIDEARKELKHQALFLAEYLDVIAQQFEVGRRPKGTLAPETVVIEQPPPAGNKGSVPLEVRVFDGGQLIFHPDRVELCGVNICSGPRSQSRRVVLELLSMRRSDGTFIAYSGEDLEAKAKEKGAKGSAGGWIRDLRDDIVSGLRNQANIVSRQTDVILSGGAGYRLAECVSVQVATKSTAIADITDMGEEPDVPDGDGRDVFDVPDGDACDVRDDAAGARKAWILQELSNERRLKAPDVAGHFGCSVKTAHRDLKALKKSGQIEFIGNARTGYYQKTFLVDDGMHRSVDVES